MQHQPSDATTRVSRQAGCAREAWLGSSFPCAPADSFHTPSTSGTPGNLRDAKSRPITEGND
jgi:hypothetical protein